LAVEEEIVFEGLELADELLEEGRDEDWMLEVAEGLFRGCESAVEGIPAGVAEVVVGVESDVPLSLPLPFRSRFTIAGLTSSATSALPDPSPIRSSSGMTPIPSSPAMSSPSIFPSSDSGVGLFKRRGREAAIDVEVGVREEELEEEEADGEGSVAGGRGGGGITSPEERRAARDVRD
jgi:hypothetical protein